VLYEYEKDNNVFESNRPGLCQSHCKDIHQKITRGQRIPKELAKECYCHRGCAPFMVLSLPPDQMTLHFLRFFNFFLIFFMFFGDF
jgi:hypothetical protein